jgi:hypothetical protein
MYHIRAGASRGTLGAMADFVFGVALGKVGQYVQNVIDNSPVDADIIAVPMSQSGTAEQAEALATLAAVEADVNFAENVGTGWSRQVLASLTYNFDATANERRADSADVVWAGPTTTAATGLLICYIPDNNATGGISADSAVIPLVHLTMAVTPDGNQVTFQFNSEGWYNAVRV